MQQINLSLSYLHNIPTPNFSREIFKKSPTTLQSSSLPKVRFQSSSLPKRMHVRVHSRVHTFCISRTVLGRVHVVSTPLDSMGLRVVLMQPLDRPWHCLLLPCTVRDFVGNRMNRRRECASHEFIEFQRLSVLVF